jgi:hypothetical protein
LSALASGSTAYLNSYRDVFEQFETHPEAKSAAPDGARCTRATRGLLARLDVHPAHESIIGKEANALDAVEAGIEHDWDDVRNVYLPMGSRPLDRELKKLATLSRCEAAKLTGLSERAVTRMRQGFTRSRRSTIKAILLAVKRLEVSAVLEGDRDLLGRPIRLCER